ncbi:MAG: hypothetical protein M0P70_13175 [Desulfobulbaceae bacterium]|nr:hypothetical protein [Desulfobulbaceae bacterium]
MDCTACHTVWPELTAFGRTFKLEGYTFSTESESGRWYPPLAAMFQASYTSLKHNNGILHKGVAPFDDTEQSAADKTNMPQQASLFYAGRITDHLGAFSQLTYDGTANEIALDNTDIRYARSFPAGDNQLVVGATINNSPTVEDIWSSTPVWGFPFASSAVAPAPAAAALIDGGLGQQVGGLGVYASWANLLYGAVSVYRTADHGITRPLAAGVSPDTITDGAVPYWRLALSRQWDRHSFEVGTYGLKADVYPGGTDTDTPDSFTDYAFDAQYQFIAAPHLFNLSGTWIHEDQDWDGSFPAGGAANPSDTLKSFKMNAGYFYRAHIGTIGGYLGYFSTEGDTDPLLYAPDPVDGSRNGSPDSNGFILQATYLWKEKYQFALQYTIYDKFNGADKNYDGYGRDAGDNNTIYLLAWLMF